MHVTLWRREANQKMCCLWTALCPQSRRLGLDYSCSLFPSTLTNLILDSCPPREICGEGSEGDRAPGTPPIRGKEEMPPIQPTICPNSSFPK